MSQKYNTEKFKKVLPKRLTELLKEKGKTQKDASEDLGIARQTLSHYMNGDTSPDSESLIKLSKYLEVSSDYLLGISDLRIPDIEIEAAANLTGLSTKTISVLNQQTDYTISSFIDMILCDDQLRNEIFFRLWDIDSFKGSFLSNHKNISTYEESKKLACFAAYIISSKIYNVLEQYIVSKDSSDVVKKMIDLEKIYAESGEEAYKKARAEAEAAELHEMIYKFNDYISKEPIK